MVRPFATLDEWGKIWGTPWKLRKKINMINVFRPSRCSLHTGGVTSSILVSPTIQSRQTAPVSRMTKTLAIPVG